MSRILGIDYGIKRTGIAVTDPLQIIATPLETIQTKNIYIYLEAYLKKENVSKIIVGLPMSLHNTPTDATSQVLSFVKKLQKKFSALIIETIDERYTSKLASNAIAQMGLKKNIREQKSLIDKASASLILQYYLTTSTPITPL